MKLATFSAGDDKRPRLGIVLNGRIVGLGDLTAGKERVSTPSTLLELIEAGEQAKEWLAGSSKQAAAVGSKSIGYALSEVRLYAPIPRPRKNVVCLGLNYKSHLEETARARGREAKLPEVPVFFTKAPTAVNGPNDDIPWDPAVTEQVDWEVELGVIIGRGGKDIPRADALSHVFGYTVTNDVSARDLQQRHLQWFKGKSLDGFCPMGPVLVTADEFGDPQSKRISLRVNGVTKQESTTAAMIFPVDAIIEFLSRGMTLEPGDIISTGTPEGVGLGRTPPEYLRDGDVMEAEVEGIGILRNRVVQRRRSG